MFKLNTNFDAHSLRYSLSHFACDGHTVHTLTQWCLSPPLTGTVKSSLFTHVHSSPCSLAARLHPCHSNCYPYSNNGWTFFWTDLACVCIYVYISSPLVDFSSYSFCCYPLPKSSKNSLPMKIIAYNFFLHCKIYS